MEAVPEAIAKVQEVASWSFGVILMVCGFMAGIMIIKSVVLSK